MVVRGRIPKVRKILIRNNVDELNTTAAGLVIAIALESIELRGKFSIALAGGSTPRSLYTLLASDNYRKKIDWSKVTFFFGDERNVPPDSDESNFRMANESLLSPLGIRSTKVNRWKTELEPVNAAAEYEVKLEENGPLDLVLLGLGPDAHTASLFPHTHALREKEKLAVANWVEKFQTNRLTMTYTAINQARDVMFLVAGQEKSDAIAAVLEGKTRVEEFPAQGIKPTSGSLTWVIDEPASSKLKPS